MDCVDERVMCKLLVQSVTRDSTHSNASTSSMLCTKNSRSKYFGNQIRCGGINKGFNFALVVKPEAAHLNKIYWLKMVIFNIRDKSHRFCKLKRKKRRCLFLDFPFSFCH